MSQSPPLLWRIFPNFSGWSIVDLSSCDFHPFSRVLVHFLAFLSTVGITCWFPGFLASLIYFSEFYLEFLSTREMTCRSFPRCWSHFLISRSILYGFSRSFLQ